MTHQQYIEAYGIPEPTIIRPHLILGSKYDLHEEGNFKKFNIKYILCCAEECNHSDMPIPKDVILKHLPIEDDWESSTNPQSTNFEDSVKFIEQLENQEETEGNLSNQTCFVHCMRGRSRSSSVILAYLMLKEKKNLKDAYTDVKSKRPFIGPHYGLRSQLINLEFHWNQENTFLMDDWETSHIEWKSKQKKNVQKKQELMENEELESLKKEKAKNCIIC
jgi:protein-tyrosine phosphatase